MDYELPPMPEFKNYGKMIEETNANVKGLELVLNEMLQAMKHQTDVIEQVVKVNQDLQKRLDSYNPANN